MKISVLINSRNRIEPLTRCLTSVFAQDYGDLEVVVLDDGSDQYELTDLLTDRFESNCLRCMRVDTPLGVARGRNLLMQHATGDILFIIDDDAMLDSKQALQCVATFFQTYPNAAILAAKIIDHRPNQEHLLLPFSQWVRRQHPQMIEQTCRISYFIGAGHALRRSAIDICGGYDPQLIYGEEELDLSYRVIEAGFEMYYLPQVAIQHYPQPSVVHHDAYRRPELYHHVRNRFFLAYKYLPWRYAVVYLFIWLVTYGWMALQQRAVVEYFGGLYSGIQQVLKIERTSLNARAVAYLQVNFGRLWY